jgi:sulfonate transport system permease protein
MRPPKINVPGIAVLLSAALVWEVAVRWGRMQFEYLPAPSQIVRAWFSLVASGEILVYTAHTLAVVAIGWCIATVIGTAFGILLGMSELAREWSLASFEVLRPLPAIAFLPLALLLFNFSVQTELVLIVYASAWPAFVNTMGGVMNVSSQLRDAGRTLKLSRLRILTKIILPAAAPAIAVGCRLSMGLTLVMAIIAEMLANPQGLGYAVATELQAMQPQRMFAYVIHIGILAIVLNLAITYVADFALRHHPHMEERRG